MAGFNPLQIEEPGASDNPLYSGTPTWADAYRTLDPNGVVSGQVDRLGQWLAEQRAKSEKMGLWANGRPTAAGWLNAAKQYSDNMLLGTSAPGIRAYHGSPHSFERFDLSKIGSGEGAQAYGHGLYFAENEGVARGYRDALSSTQVQYQGQPFNTYAHETGVKNAGEVAMNITDRVRAGVPPDVALREGIAEHRAKANAWAGRNQNLQDYNTRAADFLETIDPGKLALNKGSMYEVNLRADPEHFLDWDKPLSEQSERVQQALAEHPKLRAIMEGSDLADLPNAGAWVRRATTGRHGEMDPAEMSLMLREAGIPGIRYLDQGSRGAGQGTSNYVTFSDDIIDILRKYGIAGLMLSGAGAAGTQRQSQ